MKYYPIQQPANLIWDYVACLYPEGISDQYTFFFQQEEIEKVLYVGYWSPYKEKMQHEKYCKRNGQCEIN